jgi:hypothetical protein
MQTPTAIIASVLRPTRANARMVLAALLLLQPIPLIAQELPGGWQIGVDPGGQTEVPRTPPPPSQEGPTGKGAVRFVAQLTADGQYIDQGVIWRIFQRTDDGKSHKKLLSTHHDASPIVTLDSGDYFVNAAFGRAHLTRHITVAPTQGEPVVEPFVLNAGGLRVATFVAGKPASKKSVTYSIYSDRDQSDTRQLIMPKAKPGLIIRLNAGIYHIVSVYGDANAIVSSDVTVEAGKLTETTVSHAAARATFKLVHRAGGEAVPGTQWTIQNEAGDVVKESVGALPTHILAPGTYSAVAKFEERAFQRDFTLNDGEITQVEVIIK